MSRILRPWVVWAAVICALTAVFLWRATPALARGTLYVEGGDWLALLWQQGFWKTVTAARPDYWVLGNIVVVRVAEWLCSLLTAGGLDRMATCQVVVTCFYTAAQFAVMAGILRRHFGTGAAVLVTLTMVLVPEFGPDGVTYGEASNIGYFSAPVVAFVMLDWWLSPRLRPARLAWQVAFVAFHVLTSPAAAALVLVAAVLRAGAALFARLTSWRHGLGNQPLWLWTALSVAAAAYVWKVQSATAAGYKQAYPELLAVQWVKLLPGRQLVYPVVAPWFAHFTDALTLTAFAVVFSLWGWGLWRLFRSDDSHAARALAGIKLLAACGLALALSTTLSRQWILRLTAEGYAGLEFDRYYTAPTMLVAAGMVLTLLALARHAAMPSAFRVLAPAVVVVQLIAWVGMQIPVYASRWAEVDERAVALRWQETLARLRAIDALRPEGDWVSVPIEQPGWAMPVPREKLLAGAGDDAAAQAQCQVVFAREPVAPPSHGFRRVEAQNVRGFSDPAGLLVTWEATFDDVPVRSSGARKLWLGGLPANARAVAFFHRSPVSDRTRRDGRARSAGLLSVAVYFPGGPRADGIVPPVTEVFFGIGSDWTDLLGGGTARLTPAVPLAVPVGAIPTTDCRAVLMPASSAAVLFAPDGAEAEWTVKMPATMKARTIEIDAMAPDGFDPAVYLESNPAAAAALAAGWVTQARGHYEMTATPDTPCRKVTVRTPVPAGLSSADVDGVTFALFKTRGDWPARVAVILRGPEGQSTRWELAVPHQLPQPVRTYAAHHLRPPAGGRPWPVAAVEVELILGSRVSHWTVEALELRGAAAE